jgi:hypothetical protein
MSGPPKRIGLYGECKNLLPLPGFEARFLGRPARNLAAVPTELSATYWKRYLLI